MNEYTMDLIKRMQEYWYTLSRRQRIDIQLSTFDYDPRSGPFPYY